MRTSFSFVLTIVIIFIYVRGKSAEFFGNLFSSFFWQPFVRLLHFSMDSLFLFFMTSGVIKCVDDIGAILLVHFLYHKFYNPYCSF